MYRYEEIRQVHVEPTQLCQARCPKCDRNNQGGEVNRFLENRSLSVEQFKKIVTVDFIKQLKNMYFCGNHGDPMMAPDLIPIIKYVRENNSKMDISVVTNGGARHVDFWKELADYVTYITFSVDGLEDTNHIYRQDVDWKLVERNMRAFISAGGEARWDFIPFAHNEHQIDDASEFAKEIGVKHFVVKRSARYINQYTHDITVNFPVKNKDGELTHHIEPPVNEKYRNKVINNVKEATAKFDNSLTMLYDQSKIKPKCVEKKEIYLSSTGLIYPCCWINCTLFKFWRDKEDTEEYNVLEMSGGWDTIDTSITPLVDCVESQFFANIEHTWNNKNRLQTCQSKCNSDFDAYKSQWS